LVKQDLGIKRVCPQCAARFYDLQKRPIECPKCQFSFEPESLYKQRRTRQPEPVATVPAGADTEDEEDTEETEENEGEEIVEPVADEAPVVMAEDDDEVVEEEPEPESAGMSVVDGDDEDAAADIEVEEDEDEEEADDALLAEVEDEDDVSDIIDPDITKDEG
jgi:uncharacterized protein (TIGR02300 family)